MIIHLSIPVLLVTFFLSVAAFAAVRPLDAPAMGIEVEQGSYTVRGREIIVSRSVALIIDPPERVRVQDEEHILTNEQPRAYIGGASLKKTLGPVDTQTRLPRAIAPESVKVKSRPSGGEIFIEGKDYILDHDWGGLARLDSGRIGADNKVYVDYEVYLQRIDAIQVTREGKAIIRKGEPVPVCPRPPAPDDGCTLLASIYVPYRTSRITTENIFMEPGEDMTWRHFIKTSAREHVGRTRKLLADGKPVTIVCWGDSVTQGASPSSHDKCYVELFRNRLRVAYPEANITLINAGIGGSNTDSRRDGYESEVLAHKPDLITVEYVNDAGKSPEQIQANYTEFISRARQANPNVEFIILTPHYVMPDWMGNFPNSIPAMRAAAARNKVALGDTTNIWANLRRIGVPYESLLANGINHPDDLGHEFFAATLMQLMSSEQ